MKKLFAEKPLIHYTFVLTIVALVCGLVIGGVNAITAPIIEDNVYQAKLQAYQEVVPDLVSFEDVTLLEGAPSSLVSKVEVFDKELTDETKQTIAFIYEVYQTNKFGQIRFVVSVSSTGEILGASFVTLEQTYKQDATTRNLQDFVGLNLSNLGAVADLESGATGSLNTLKAMFADVANEFANSQPEPEFTEPIDQLYQAFTTQTDDTAFASQATATVLSRQIVTKTAGGDVLGYIYKLTGTTQYQSPDDGGASGSITLYVHVDNDHNILLITAPSGEYNHSKGGYYSQTTAFLAEFTGENLSDVRTIGDTILAGATARSRNLVIDLLEDLKEVILP
jgi:Na+-translocating ferredoxin:NAD+ oxidoreductase RnfG subunit